MMNFLHQQLLLRRGDAKLALLFAKRLRRARESHRQFADFMRRALQAARLERPTRTPAAHRARQQLNRIGHGLAGSHRHRCHPDKHQHHNLGNPRNEQLAIVAVLELLPDDETRHQLQRNDGRDQQQSQPHPDRVEAHHSIHSKAKALA